MAHSGQVDEAAAAAGSGGRDLPDDEGNTALHYAAPWGEARPECKGAGPAGPAGGHIALLLPPARNQPEAARVP